MEKITKEELLKKMNMSAMSDEELENIAGGEDESTFSECLNKSLSILQSCRNSCGGVIGDACDAKCYSKHNTRVNTECRLLL